MATTKDMSSFLNVLFWQQKFASEETIRSEVEKRLQEAEESVTKFRDEMEETTGELENLKEINKEQVGNVADHSSCFIKSPLSFNDRTLTYYLIYE